MGVAVRVWRVASRALRRGAARAGAVSESEQRYKSLFDHNPDAVYSFDPQGRFTSMNAVGVALTGRNDTLERTFADLVHPEDLPRVQGHFGRAVAGEPQHYECRVVRPDGGVVPILVTNSAIVVDGEVVGVFGVAKDMSERVAIERGLTESKQRYKALYHGNPDPVYSLDLDGRFTAGNQACLTLTGHEPRALHRVPLSDLVHPADRAAVATHFARAVGGEPVDYECTMLRADGSPVNLRILNIPIVVDGAVIGVYGLAKDITERRRLEQELRRQARSDALTRLPNRAELLEHLAGRLAGQRTWLLFIDLDRFKVVNDSLGHEVGDRLLCAVAARLRAELRHGDLLVRFGGDEFCVALGGSTTAEDARVLAGRVVEAVRPPFVIGDEELYITASVGIAVGELQEQPDELLRRADIAMYQAKAAGRDGAAVYAAGASEAARSQLSLETELRGALERDELVLHHQPQFEVARGGTVLVGAESLVRWQHPQRGLLAPAAFLPAVEAAGLSVALDRWVLGTAVRAAASWPADTLSVSVNVSPESLLSAAWAESVVAALASSGLPADRLTVEVTEGAVIAEPERVRLVLGELRALGVKVALDDFGTGWSSLSYLERYPVDVLKIDRLFVSRLSDETPSPVVDAILSLARALGLRTVAEGVETEAQRDRLVGAGCDGFQGYLFSRPLPDEQFRALLAVYTAGIPTARPEPGTRAQSAVR